MGTFPPGLRSVLSAVSSSGWNPDGGTAGRLPDLFFIRETGGYIRLWVRWSERPGRRGWPLLLWPAVWPVSRRRQCTAPPFSAFPAVAHDDSDRSTLLVLTPPPPTPCHPAPASCCRPAVLRPFS